MNSTTSHYRIVSCDNKNGEGKEMWLSSKPLGATMKQRQRGFIFRQWKKGPPNYIKTVVQVRETTFTPDKIRYCKKDYHLSVFSWTQIISHLEIVWHSIENLCICLRFGGMQQPFSWELTLVQWQWACPVVRRGEAYVRNPGHSQHTGHCGSMCRAGLVFLQEAQLYVHSFMAQPRNSSFILQVRHRLLLCTVTQHWQCITPILTWIIAYG